MLQGCKATICMPVTTPEIKVDAVRRMGGLVELIGESYSETQAAAQVNELQIVPCTFGLQCCKCTACIMSCMSEAANCPTRTQKQGHGIDVALMHVDISLLRM